MKHGASKGEVTTRVEDIAGRCDAAPSVVMEALVLHEVGVLSARNKAPKDPLKGKAQAKLLVTSTRPAIKTSEATTQTEEEEGPTNTLDLSAPLAARHPKRERKGQDSPCQKGGKFPLAKGMGKRPRSSPNEEESSEGLRKRLFSEAVALTTGGPAATGGQMSHAPAVEPPGEDGVGEAMGQGDGVGDPPVY